MKERVGPLRPIRSLTALRFFAAMLVFAWHIGLLKNLQLGYVGVSFFYALSGFILAYNYSPKFSQLSRKSVLSFYSARFARIYPVYLMSFFLAVPVTPERLFASPSQWVISGLANIFLVQSFIPNMNIFFGFNGVAWSLSDEMWFYVLFPFLLYSVLRLSAKYNKQVVVLAGALSTWLALVLFLLPQHVGLNNWLTYVFPVTRLPDFVVGMLMGVRFLNGPSTNDKSPRQYSLFTLLEVSGVLLVIASILYSPYVEQSLRFSAFYIPIWAYVISVFAYQRGALSRILSLRFPVFLGNLSFVFYMVHQVALKYLALFPSLANLHGMIVILFVLIVSVSALLYRFYEEPLRKIVRVTLTHRLSTSPHSDIVEPIRPAGTYDTPPTGPL